MGVVLAPQWLLPSFVRSVQGAGATASPDEIRAVGEDLIERWCGPGRHFHTLKHLTDVLARVPPKRPLTAGSGTWSLGVGLAAAFC